MKPVAFRIRDFKSITDSQICRLSTDGITVLAGENESGKTAILSALRDFNLSPGDEPKTTDFLPDDDFGRKPSVSICFEVDWTDLLRKLEERGISVPASIEQLLTDQNPIWITRDLVGNHFSLDEAIVAKWAAALATAEFEKEPSPDGDEAEPEEDDVERADSEWATAAEFADALFDYWPVVVYFSTFDDILPRT